MTPEQVKKAMDVDCPYCNALAGEKCVTVERNLRVYNITFHRSQPHITRLRYAESPE